MKKNLELVLLIINWVIVAIQAFTIFLYGNSIGLFIIMLLALIAQVFSAVSYTHLTLPTTERV